MPKNNYWENVIFSQFLLSIDDCTLSEMGDYDIQFQLNNLTMRAIADFKFPQISLEYDFDEITDKGETVRKYYFENKITQREVNVILTRMKQYWIEYQISQEELFNNLYFDKDIRTFSPGNTIDKLIKMLTTFRKAAERVELDYHRVAVDGTPGIGDINV